MQNAIQYYLDKVTYNISQDKEYERFTCLTDESKLYMKRKH